MCGLPNQSAIDAPSGRVMTYAAQKAAIGFSFPRHQATAGMVMSTAKRTMELRKPSFSVYAVRSPAAVPSAKVASTAVQ